MRRRFFNNNIEYFDINDYLTIEALEDNLQIYFPNEDLMYGIDGLGWQKLVAGAYSPAISKGQTISFKGNLTPSTSGIGRFTINKKCNLKGNCMSILFGDNAADNYSLSSKSHAFCKLFYNCKNIVNVSSNFLPATTLAMFCYYSMFDGCTNLTSAPALPATTLESYCYYGMFQNCTSLTTAPELPAMTLASYCYNDMFSGCTSLTTAPELPATILADYCYNGMFYDCASLTTAPVLPATTLANCCYYYMFLGCSNLTSAPALPATTLDIYCYCGMFEGCTSLTTAPELPATTLTRECYRWMFSGCTSLTTAPELPATTLAMFCYYSMFDGCTNLTSAPALPATTLESYCYSDMFRSCTSLTTAPELPAKTLAVNCYYWMFQGCSKLNYIKMLATNISANNCLNSWVKGVASSGTFVKHPHMTTLSTGEHGIPSGWTVEDYVEPISLCDVAYYDGNTVKTCSYDNYSTSLGTAIGVVVIPSGFAPDGKARIIGLKPMDASGNMTDSHTLMTWGGSSMGYYTDTTLTNYTMVPITDNAGSTSSGSNHIGYFPSDKFTGAQSYVDPEAKYNYDDYLIPSPYLGDAPNPEYYKTISGNNVLSDFNGLTNTQTLVGLGSSNYQAANACWNYTDGTSSNVQWYLPAMGELGYLIVRLKAINEVITSLGGVAVDSNSYFWSSSEYSGMRVWAAHVLDGSPTSYTKSMSGYMYAFATIDNGGGSNLITFTINNTEYQAEEGMTFYDWAMSEYYDSSCNLSVLGVGGHGDLRDKIINGNISPDDSFIITTMAGVGTTPIINTDTIIQPISYTLDVGGFD